MKNYVITIFILFILSYLLSFSITFRRFRKARKYFFFAVQILFIAAGMAAKPFAAEIIEGFKSYIGISAIILIAMISFISAMEFRLNRLRRLDRINTYTAVTMMTATALPIVLLLIYTGSESIFISICTGLFLSGTAFSYVTHSTSMSAKRTVYTAILSPLLLIAVYFIVLMIKQIQSWDVVLILQTALYLTMLILIIPVTNYFSHIFSRIEWTITLIAFIFIITPFSVHLGIIPVLPAFIAGLLFTNLNPINADRFLSLFKVTEKPAYLILLFTAGIFIEPALSGLYLALVIILIRLLFKVFILRTFRMPLKNTFVLNGLGGFEFICLIALYLTNGVDGTILFSAAIVILSGQIIQGVYSDVSK